MPLNVQNCTAGGGMLQWEEAIDRNVAKLSQGAVELERPNQRVNIIAYSKVVYIYYI